MEVCVSIILPTYNRAKTIMDSINSILKQTYPYWELIIVDDASCDETGQLIAEIQDARVKYIPLKENVGPAIARNVGIQNAKYDYIAFEDSDDVWLPEKLERQMALFDEQTGMVYCAFQYVNGNAGRIPPVNDDENSLSGYIFQTLWSANRIGTPTIIAKKQCLQEVGGFSEKLKSLEDWELVLRISEKYKIKFLNETLVHAKFSGSGVNNNNSERIKSVLYIMDEFEEKKLDVKNMLNLIFDDLSYISSKEELVQWKSKIVPKYIASEEEFEFILQIKKKYKKLVLDNRILEAFCCADIFKKFVNENIDIGKDIVGIYGMGIIGRSLYYQLSGLGINVEIMIDKGKKMFDGKKVYHLDEICERKLTKIFITIPEEYDLIAHELKQYVHSDFINVYRIVEY